MMAAALTTLVLGATLEITGETATVLFNAHSNAQVLRMDAHDGVLNVSAGILAHDGPEQDSFSPRPK